MTHEQALQDKISQLEKQLEKSQNRQQQKEQFFATTIHELRTPLNAIVGLSSVLIESDIEKPLSDYISQIDTSSQLLVSLVNDILDFSKIEAGKLEIEHISFPLSRIIDNIATIVGMQAKQKGLQLRFDIDDAIATEITGDPLRLTQVLINLTNNAVKFTHQGTITVKAKLLTKKNESDLIEFGVSDTGIGLTQKQIDRLFENFMQADSSTSRQYGGTGLGLTISKRLVELMGGTIRVESRLDKGADFIFTIEQKPIVAGTVASHMQKRSDLKKDLSQCKDAHILVVDDDTVNQSVIVALLKDTGIEITLADNGQEALDAIDQNDTIDLILMDINMPIMSGFEATTILRNDPKYPNTPIIAFSGDSSDTAITEAKTAGMNDMLFKPIAAEEFYRQLNKYLKTEQTIEQRYVESAQEFDNWLEKYKYQKIMALANSIKQENKTKENEALHQQALLVEKTIVKYKNLFLILIKNHTKVVETYKQCVHTIEKSQGLTTEQKKRLSSLMDEKNVDNSKALSLFAEKLTDATEEMRALVDMLQFNKATLMALSLQKEAKALAVHSVARSLSPIIGIEATQRSQLKSILHTFRDELEKIQTK